jgi:hypothetical protein
MPKTKSEYTKVALKAEGNLFDRNLGKIECGYVILEKDIAEQWIDKFPDKARIVTPEEVAAVFG